LRTFLILLSLLSTSDAAAAAVPSADIHFPGRMEAPAGGYEARLATDGVPDNSLLALRLSRPGGGRENLLEPATMSHGLQPFTFPASDYSGTIDGSIYGRVRHIPIRGSRNLLRVTVLRAVVTKTGTGRFPWRFRTLDLALAIEPPPPRR
jgi:hypothetical protein